MKTIGVDLGGSHVLATIVDGDGQIVDRAEREMVDRTFGAAIETIGEAIEEVRLRAAGTVTAIGLGSPGSIDLTTGTVEYSPNFGWHGVPLGARLRERFDMPVFIANDARCATLGEHAYGTGRGSLNFVLLTLGTGVGGGIIADGKLLIGNNAAAGEVGHHQVRATDGFCCNCGKVGCFEAQASATGLVRHALAIAHCFPRSRIANAKPEELGSKEIGQAAESGDPHGLAAWNRYVDDLARGLANVIAFVNPELIALGGGVAAAGELLLGPVRLKVDEYTTMAPRGGTRIVAALLGNDAGPIGAATMARRGGLTAEPHAQ